MLPRPESVKQSTLSPIPADLKTKFARILYPYLLHKLLPSTRPLLHTCVRELGYFTRETEARKKKSRSSLEPSKESATAIFATPLPKLSSVSRVLHVEINWLVIVAEGAHLGFDCVSPTDVRQYSINLFIRNSKALACLLGSIIGLGQESWPAFSSGIDHRQERANHGALLLALFARPSHAC